MTSTEVQQQNTTLIQIGGAVPPNHTLLGPTVIAHVSIEVPQQNEGVSSASSRDSKKVGYSELRFGA